MKFFFRFLIGIGLKLLIIQHFDFLREPHSVVPLYADECGSLGFVAFSTVSSVCIISVPCLSVHHISGLSAHKTSDIVGQNLNQTFPCLKSGPGYVRSYHAFFA